VSAWFDHLFFLTLVILFPLRAAFSGMRRLRRAPATELPRVRLEVYREAILLQWGLLAILFASWIANGRAWHALGAVPALSTGFLVLAGLTIVAVVLIARQRAAALVDDEALAGVRTQLQHLEVMLPHEPNELGWFFRLSFTAGVCEEFLYRGYMIWYLAHWMPMLAAAGVSSVIFGLGHAYQGRRGVLTTGLFGALLAAVYMLSGSLLIPIVLHGLLDAHSGHLGFRAIRRGRELERERVAAEAARMAEEQLARREELERERAAAEAEREAAERDAIERRDESMGGDPSSLPHAASPGLALPAERAYDVIVAGLGAMGSAAAYHLAARGARVLGIDRFRSPHDMGSSHGETRLIREAYFEAPFYVPIVQRAYELWQALELESGRPLMKLTGGLMIGPRDGELARGALRSAEAHALPVEWLDTDELRRRYPAFRVPDATGAVWEPRTGMLFPEACVAAHLDGARARGAMLRLDDPVRSWRPDGEGVEVETASGRWRAHRLLLANGAWLGDLARDIALPLRVSRQTLHWFEPAARPEQFDAEHFPSWIWEYEPDTYVYGFPRLGGTVKAALHVPGPTVDPATLARATTPEEAERLAAALRRCVPDLAGPHVRGAVCMYTNTPDGHFVIDAHPAHRQVLIASACSGHGFKFSSALGETFADLLLDAGSRYDLTPFRIGRFAEGAAPEGGRSTAFRS
jgi:sarcosine oxidase